ncbi:acyl-CoA dehydrogenase family protein [Streptomyces mexicanus]|jgi:alkylation response protein AidB-like acyl-CoA dehydrogenase|uniref:Acyl-CoA dehydrogenase family protein n=1 Tax=Streptomyces mexicanus TaxID=178566 RepID=A0A7X1LR21_9ACTN|nr:acyl-CoA dehydrogenase family protein [Streptomyces mexicanus]MBC2864956.1 acyl-CoA dehydrogenase family protein [Streptomyces mexicanus]
MKLNWTSEEESFRAELRGFLQSVQLGKPPKDKIGRTDWARRWNATLCDNGFAGPGWPKEYGGMALDLRHQVIYHEELARARVPAPPGTGVAMCGPTIIKHGTPEQRERFLKPMLRSDEVWCQAFSEPGAGSDLPSLTTTARRDGDDYVVNGQKVWNSAADVADMAFTLVRTGARDSRQKGISYLLIDMKSPGVEVRPLKDITGGAAFCEIFFDDVRVPVANRIGEENEGWKITRTTLGHERSAGVLKQAAFYRNIVDEIYGLLRERGTTEDPVSRDRLADLEVQTRILQVNALRILSHIQEYGEPGPIASVNRLINSTFEQRLHEIALELLGPAGLLDGADGVQGRRWTYGYLRTRASTIGAGTMEIQRNAVAEQVLGMPFDPAMPPR